MGLADRIKEARKAAGYDTQQSFADEIGVERASVSQWESPSKPTRPRPDHLAKIVDLTGRSFEWFLAGADSVQWVPVLSWVSAGAMVDPMSQFPIEDVPLLAFADLGRGDWFALRVKGDSMDRVSPDGSVILVNRAERELLPGRKYVFSLRGEATYKQWEAEPPRLEPVTTNPQGNKTIYPQGDGDYAVVGRVRRTLLDL